MASIYKKISKNIEELIIDNPKTAGKSLLWININNAKKPEIEYLRKKYNFSLSQLQASSSRINSQRSLVEKDPDYIFMILHFPQLENETVKVIEVELFIGPDYLVTIHNNIRSINECFNLFKKDCSYSISYESESVALLIYEIWNKLMDNTFNLLDKYSVKIYELEELIFSQESKKAASHILYMRRNIIHARKIMQNQKNIIKKMISPEMDIVHSEEAKNYGIALLEKSKRIWENLENQKDMIEVLNSTNESFLNYRISDIMKTLTIFSVIVFPLTLMAAIFGMNTINGMPFIDRENGFWFIIGIMLLGSLGMLIFFKKKKWL